MIKTFYYSSLFLTSLFSTSVLAQTTPVVPARPQVTTPAISIANFTKDFKKQEGYFNFYYDEKTGKVFLEIAKFDEEFLYFSSLTDGAGRNAERGGASADVTKFIKVGPKVCLLEPNLAYRAGNGNTDEVKTVEGSFAKSVIWGFNPVAIEGDKVLIDLTPFYRNTKSVKGMGFSHQACFVRTDLAKENLFSDKYKLTADYNQLYNLYYRDNIAFKQVDTIVAVMQ